MRLNTSRSSGEENNQYNGQDLLAEKILTECNSKRYQQFEVRASSYLTV